MIELEKLAKEYAEAGNHYYPDERDIANAFKFGFIEAREMALKLTDQSLIHCQCALHIKDMGKEKE